MTLLTNPAQELGGLPHEDIPASGAPRSSNAQLTLGMQKQKRAPSGYYGFA
jgi:hypothetical protein